MSYTLLIFLGAGLGGVFRFWVANGVHFFVDRQFPYGILVVNMTGSFLMGLFFVFILSRFEYIGPQLRSLLLIGFLGGYTTFSSFSLETLLLFENGAWVSALLNVVLSVTLCLLMAWLGVVAGRQF